MQLQLLDLKTWNKQLGKHKNPNKLTTHIMFSYPFPFLEIAYRGITLCHAFLPVDGILNAHTHCCAVNEHILKSVWILLYCF